MTIPTADGRRFSVGKYVVIATPIAGSSHMLRYTVFLDGRRIGATASVPGESDCRFLERPPQDPEPIPYQSGYRPRPSVR
jgi:hypothetical protein